MAITPASVFRQTNPYENLISQIIKYESRPQQRLEQRLDEQQGLKDVIGKTDSKLSALDSAITPFSADASSSPFEALTANVSDTDAFSVTASDSAAVGPHTLEVEQLAKTDTRISQQYQSDGTGLPDWFNSLPHSVTMQEFDITVASPTDADPENRETISVSIDPNNITGATNEEVLTEVKTAIDTAMSDAVNAGTIDADEKASISVVNESSGTARLSIRSADTGYGNRLEFTETNGSLLQELEIGQNQMATDTGGGQVYDVGTSQTDSALSSKFILDGITMYRDSNKVTDALDGVTLNLEQAGGPAADFSIEADSESIVGEVKSFVEKFNAVQDFIQTKTNVDEDTQTRGPLADDYAIRGLRYDLQDDATRKVDSQPADAPSYLSDIGITVSSDGKMSIEDEDALIQAIEDDTEDVKSLFNGADGVATRMKNRLGSYLGINGLMDNRKDGVGNKIDRLNDQIDDWDDRLARREDQLRQEFAQVQQTITQFQSQQNSLANFGGGGGGFTGGQLF
jgi:flagellar hook-associated protein 2